jgi:signal transduction histidine kinase
MILPSFTVIDIACAGIYAYVAFHFGGLRWMRQTAGGHGAFARLSLALVAYALTDAYVMATESVADAALGQSAQCIAAMLTIGSFVVFCLHVSGRPSPRLERNAWAFTFSMAALGATGLFVDPAEPARTFDGSSVALGGRPLAAIAPIGIAALAGACIFALIAILHLMRAAHRDRTLRALFLASLLIFAVGIFDLVALAVQKPYPFLSAIAPVVAFAGISWALVGRFAGVDVELATRTEELAASYDRLRQAQQELVRKEQLAAIGELSAVIAHEVRNPLAIIRNAVSRLRKAHPSERETETLLRILDEEGDGLNRLVQDLLTYARPADPEPRIVDLPEILARTVTITREAQSDSKNIHLDFWIAPGSLTVECDPTLLRHALINIVDNAIHAMPAGGRIGIRCQPALIEDRPAVAIAFHDEGEGMDTAVRRKARDLFFTTRATGTGLGLAIVERVARVHGGRVEIESRPGQGTTVTLLLPRARTAVS